jgi:hypothetical protein
MWPVEAAATTSEKVLARGQGGLMPSRRRSAQLGALLATLLLTAACGTTEPKPLTAMKPEVPADLCATVPSAARDGLVANSNTDSSGNPTAACSLRSPDGAKTEVRAVVTWLQTNDEVTAGSAFDSQCRAIDLAKFQEQAGFQAAGADRACAGSGKFNGSDGATMAAVTGREVITVRLSSRPPAAAPAAARAQQMLEGVLKSLSGDS